MPRAMIAVMSGGARRWLLTVVGMAAVLGLVAGAAVVLRSSEDDSPPGATGGPGVRLPPPRSLQELVSFGDIVVAAEVVDVRERRDVEVDGEPVRLQSFQLSVTEYLKGGGPTTLLVHQVVSRDGAEGLAYAMTVPPAGARGFFFLSAATQWGTGGYSAAFGADGRILEGSSGQAILDRPERPAAAFLVGRTMADVDREIRSLITSASAGSTR